MKKKPLLKSVSYIIIILIGLSSCKKNDLQDPEKIDKTNSPSLPEKSAPTDLIPSPKDSLNKISFLDLDNQPGGSKLPAVFTLKSPGIANQLLTSSCTGWAGVYCAWSIEYSNHSLTGNKEVKYNNNNTFNPGYIYSQYVDDCRKGTSLYAVLSHLVREGALPISAFSIEPVSCENLPFKPDNIQRAEASKYKIPNLRLYQAPKDEMSIKQFIRSGHPIIIACREDQSMYTLQTPETFVWSIYSIPIVTYSALFLDTKNYGKEFRIAHHAMTIIGYDDHKRAYKVQNSRGDRYADHGCLWISYDFFEKGKITTVPILKSDNSMSSGFGIGYIAASAPEDVFDEAYVFY